MGHKLCIVGTPLIVSFWLGYVWLYCIWSVHPNVNAGLEGTHHERRMGFWGTSSCDRWSDRVHNLPCRQCWLDGWPRHTRHVTWWQYQVSTLSKSVSVLLCFDKCLNAAGSVAVGTNSFTASWPTEHPQQLAACRPLPRVSTVWISCLHWRFRPEPHSREAYRTFLSTHPRILD